MDNPKEIRWMQRFENLKSSFNYLEEYSSLDTSDAMIRFAVIKTFEMTFELSWKVMKDYLESKDIVAQGPRDVIKNAFQIELIEDGHAWLEVLSNRNLMVHTYNEDLAIKVVDDIIKSFIPEIKKLLEKLEELT